MELTQPDFLAALERSRAVMRAAVRETLTAAEQRAERVARGLHSVWPSSLHACWLRRGDASDLAVIDTAGNAITSGVDTVRQELQRWTQPSRGDAVPLREARWTRARLYSAPIETHDHHFGALALALPESANEVETAQALAVLKECAAYLAPLQALAAVEAPLEPDALERLNYLDNVSELTAHITHEFNNILNGILLHIAVLKQEVPPEIVPELDVIRGLGNNASALVKKLQQYNSKRRGLLEPVNLNEAVRKTAAQRTGMPGVQLALDPNLPRAQAKPRELRRLLQMLLDQAEAARGATGGTITIRTAREGKRVLLRVEDPGPPISPDDLPYLFEPFRVVRPGGDEATLAVCHTLARHLQGSLRAENLAGGGVVMIVEFSPARE
jgi:signal transduction histidine kinase